MTAWNSMVTACVVLADMHADLRLKLAIQSRYRPQFSAFIQGEDVCRVQTASLQGLTALSNALELDKTEWILRKLWMSCPSRHLLSLGSQPLLHIFGFDLLYSCEDSFSFLHLSRQVHRGEMT